MKVPLLDLTRQFAPLEESILAEIQTICRSQSFILGPKVAEFEAAVARYSGARHAVGVSSGTDGQIAVQMAAGIGPGDAVLTTPYTFFATAGGIARSGAQIVFADINRSTFNLDPAKVESWIRSRCIQSNDGGWRTPEGNRLRAIIPVHLFGCCADMDAFTAMAREFRLLLLEDSSQAIGAEYPSADGNVRKAGSMGDFSWFSFFPTKNLGGFGDGGMVTCREASDAAKLRAMRNHGMEEQYYHRYVGGNFRLDALQAAILLIKLPHLDAWSSARRDNAAFYREQFTNAGLIEAITLPVEPYAPSAAKRHHIYNQYVIRASRRDELKAHLQDLGIGTAIYYPVPLHLQECFQSLGYKKGDFPEAENAASESLALPIFPELTRDEITCVVQGIRSFYK